ncbi:hypothetical protein BDV95DRAFT_611970 [Massariosphaeria phaeospora]|uniref:Uncharacterized protein n=1 Tax=Massariosphaeria phaeospora TaxID=100035 RepID=A0A7C8M2C7_9PLEO|nr:hypothetical protein BDV95DRAFT_611970 [Massariosphaeria phaeospora]
MTDSRRASKQPVRQDLEAPPRDEARLANAVNTVHHGDTVLPLAPQHNRHEAAIAGPSRTGVTDWAPTGQAAEVDNTQDSPLASRSRAVPDDSWIPKVHAFLADTPQTAQSQTQSTSTSSSTQRRLNPKIVEARRERAPFLRTDSMREPAVVREAPPSDPNAPPPMYSLRFSHKHPRGKLYDPEEALSERAALEVERMQKAQGTDKPQGGIEALKAKNKAWRSTRCGRITKATVMILVACGFVALILLFCFVGFNSLHPTKKKYYTED